MITMLSAVCFGSANVQFRFGIKAGLNVNKIHINKVSDNFQPDNGCGFTGGVMTEFTVPVIGLCFDASLMYTRMNSGIDVNSSIDEQQSISHPNGKDFFEIPVNLKYKLSLPVIGSVFTPYIFTGPSFAFKLNNSDNVFNTKTFQCAWNVGLGIQLINHLQIGASYGFGVNNIMKSVAGVDVTNDFKSKNNYWTVTAAWLF